MEQDGVEHLRTSRTAGAQRCDPPFSRFAAALGQAAVIVDSYLDFAIISLAVYASPAFSLHAESLCAN